VIPLWIAAHAQEPIADAVVDRWLTPVFAVAAVEQAEAVTTLIREHLA
jgi:hypothetical protein